MQIARLFVQSKQLNRGTAREGIIRVARPTTKGETMSSTTHQHVTSAAPADRSITRRAMVAGAAATAGTLALMSASRSTGAQNAAFASESSDAASESASSAPSDGTFSGTATSFGWLGPMTCDVTFKDGAITDIEVTQETDSATGEWFASARDILIPRIIESQSIGVDTITGATFSSAAILECVAQAIDAAGGDSEAWRIAPETSNEVVTLDGYDVIVVGLGGSGIMSYCAAAHQGAKVFGIEAAGKVGGNSACTYGPMALNSAYLEELFTNGEDYIDEDDVYNTWIDYVGTEEKSDIISEAVYRSGSVIDYYHDNFGFEFEGYAAQGGLIGSFVNPEWDKMWCVYSADDNNTSWNAIGPNKTFQFTRALDKAKEFSADSDYMTELKANELIFGDDGTVAGVRATYYDGTTYEIYGNAVVLATGGFIGNAQMMEEYLGSTTNVLGSTVDAGDGIMMGQSAGGALYATGTLPMIHISQVANMIRTDDLTADQKAILSALALTTDHTMVTTTGEPWGVPAEDGSVVTSPVLAPGYRYYVVYGQADIDDIRKNGLSEAQAAAAPMFVDQGGTLPAAGTPVDDIDTILEVGESYGDVYSAENAQALAEAIDIDSDTLAATLGDAGLDVDATLYAVPCCGYAYATVGGLDVNANMNVLDENGEPIANLYAVGQDSEGVCNADGQPYTPWGGQAQSWTFVSGQIAGTLAAGGTI